MKTNKLKLLAPLICIPTTLGALSTIVACSKSEDKKQATYNVTINESERFTYDLNKIGENKATKGQNFEIKLTFALNFQANKEDISIKIGNQVTDQFDIVNNTIKINGSNITGNIDINITPSVVNLFNIGTNGRLLGFYPGLTQDEISRTCNGILTIPMNVVSIANNAFYDEENDESKIPSSITELVFDEHLDAIKVQSGNVEKWEISGQSWLKDYSDFNGIGSCAFKKSPFKHIKLPVGSGYTISKSAFELSKVEILEMPQPDYVETDEQATYYGVDKGNWKIAAYFKQESNRNKWIEKNRMCLLDRAFFNTQNLKYISFSVFTNFEGAYECFNILDAEENTVPSNATVLDLSSYCQLRFADANDATKKNTASKCIDDFNDLKNASDIVLPSGFSALQNQFNFALTTDEVEKTVYLLFSDMWEVNETPEQQVNFVNEFLYRINLSTITNFDDKISNNCYAVRSRNNLIKTKTSPQSKFDSLKLKNSTTTINVSSQISERKQEINLDDVTLAKAGLKGDFEYEITKAEWTTGKEVPLQLKHITRSEMPEAERKTYLNNLFTIIWDTTQAPKANDVVKLTFNINSIHTLRQTQELELTITFA